MTCAIFNHLRTARQHRRGRSAPLELRRRRLVFLVRALEVFDAFAVEVPDSGGDFFEQIVVVRDQEQRPFVLLQAQYSGR